MKEVNTLFAKIKALGKRERERSLKNRKKNRIGGWFCFNASCLGSGYMCSLLSRPLQTTSDDDVYGRAAGLCKYLHEAAWKNGTVECGSETRKKWVSITKCNWPNKEHLLGDNDVRLLTRSRSNAAQLYGQWNLHNLLVERSPSKEFKYLFIFFSAELSFQIGTRNFSACRRDTQSTNRREEAWNLIKNKAFLITKSFCVIFLHDYSIFSMCLRLNVFIKATRNSTIILIAMMSFMNEHLSMLFIGKHW